MRNCCGLVVRSIAAQIGAPAGSVDASASRPNGRPNGHPNGQPNGSIDLTAQLLTELREEIGLEPADVYDPKPLCLVEHPGSHVSDLGISLSTGLTGAEILAAHAAHGNGEYDPLRVVALANLADFLQQAGNLVVPPAFAFLRRAGLLV